MITLTDGSTVLTLNHILWPNRAQSPGVGGSEQLTIGGRLNVQRAGGSGGREISLVASLSGDSLRGWWTWSQVVQLMAWRDAGTTLTLSYDGETRTGVIPISGIDISPVRQTSNAPGTDQICAGTLTIVET